MVVIACVSGRWPVNEWSKPSTGGASAVFTPGAPPSPQRIEKCWRGRWKDETSGRGCISNKSNAHTALHLFASSVSVSLRCSIRSPGYSSPSSAAVHRSSMAATLTVSGGGQDDPFYPLQKATLPAVFSLEDSVLFGLDCKLSDKAGLNDYSLQVLHTLVHKQIKISLCTLWWCLWLDGRGSLHVVHPLLMCLSPVWPPKNNNAIDLFADVLISTSTCINEKYQRGQLATLCSVALPPTCIHCVFAPSASCSAVVGASLTIIPSWQQLTATRAGLYKGPGNSARKETCGRVKEPRNSSSSRRRSRSRNSPFLHAPAPAAAAAAGRHGCFPIPFHVAVSSCAAELLQL